MLHTEQCYSSSLLTTFRTTHSSNTHRAARANGILLILTPSSSHPFSPPRSPRPYLEQLQAHGEGKVWWFKIRTAPKNPEMSGCLSDVGEGFANFQISLGRWEIWKTVDPVDHVARSCAAPTSPGCRGTIILFKGERPFCQPATWILSSGLQVVQYRSTGAICMKHTHRGTALRSSGSTQSCRAYLVLWNTWLLLLKVKRNAKLGGYRCYA